MMDHTEEDDKNIKVYQTAICGEAGMSDTQILWRAFLRGLGASFGVVFWICIAALIRMIAP